MISRQVCLGKYLGWGSNPACLTAYCNNLRELLSPAGRDARMAIHLLSAAMNSLYKTHRVVFAIKRPGISLVFINFRRSKDDTRKLLNPSLLMYNKKFEFLFCIYLTDHKIC
jgi:hypothetical protein